MQERERILELVKKGILTTEEALVLLENMTQKKEQNQLVQEEQVKIEKDPIVVENKEERFDKERTIKAQLNEIEETLSQLNEELKQCISQKQTYDTMEELETITEQQKEQAQELFQKIQQIKQNVSSVQKEKEALQEKERQLLKEKVKEKINIPEDWKEQTSDTFQQVTDKLSEASTHLGGFLKKTMHHFTDTLNENMEWKDVNVKVPGLATTKFQHSFHYPEINASLMDIKLATGSVLIKTHDSSDLKVEAQFKLYDKIKEQSPVEKVLEKSHIEVNEEKISFQIPSKHIKADLIFYLPKKEYDYLSINVLNGPVALENWKGKDLYVKATNGALSFIESQATMLEVHGVNGDVSIDGGHYKDIFVESINGDISLKQGDMASLQASTVNGNIKVTQLTDQLETLKATTVEGTIKIAFPETLSVEGNAKTSFGEIKERVKELVVLKEKYDTTARPLRAKKQTLSFEKMNPLAKAPIAQFQLATTSGDIYLKTNDK